MICGTCKKPVHYEKAGGRGVRYHENGKRECPLNEEFQIALSIMIAQNSVLQQARDLDEELRFMPDGEWHEVVVCPHEFRSTERVLTWKGEDGSFGGAWRDVEDNFCRDCGKPRPL